MMLRARKILALIVLGSCFVGSCTPQVSAEISDLSVTETDTTRSIEISNTVTPTIELEQETESASPQEAETPTLAATEEIGEVESMTPTPDTRPLPRNWAGWPVIPVVSDTSKNIYQQGIEMGNNPQVFSVIGDCQSEPNVFLGIYETERSPIGPDEQALLETIGHFWGSYSQVSQSVKDGMSAPTALSPLWADREICEPNESPVECELRLTKPVIVFVNLGTNWKPGASADKYKDYLVQIVEFIIEKGAVPILSTKADNVEGDHSINRVTAEVAYEYDIPLWNFWLAADSLPNHGLDADRGNIYLTPQGWDRRNYTALQVLDFVWRELESGMD